MISSRSLQCPHGSKVQALPYLKEKVLEKYQLIISRMQYPVEVQLIGINSSYAYPHIAIVIRQNTTSLLYASVYVPPYGGSFGIVMPVISSGPTIIILWRSARELYMLQRLIKYRVRIPLCIVKCLTRFTVCGQSLFLTIVRYQDMLELLPSEYVDVELHISETKDDHRTIKTISGEITVITHHNLCSNQHVLLTGVTLSSTYTNIYQVHAPHGIDIYSNKNQLPSIKWGLDVDIFPTCR